MILSRLWLMLGASDMAMAGDRHSSRNSPSDHLTDRRCHLVDHVVSLPVKCPSRGKCTHIQSCQSKLTELDYHAAQVSLSPWPLCP